MNPLNTPQNMADFLAGAGYPRAEIEATVSADFPDADTSKVVDVALRKKREWDERLDGEVQKERDAAIAAEHDEGGT
jgi:hypothetical protein